MSRPAGPLARTVTRRATAVLLLALTTVGLATGALLHVRAVRSLDTTLLAAAEAHAVPHPEPDWVEQVLPDRLVDVAFIDPDDPDHPAADLARAVVGQRPPLIETRDGRRWLVLDLVSHTGGPPPEGLPSRVVAASAPAVTPGRSVGPFALVYVVVASIVAAAAATALQGWLTATLVPLRRAAEDVRRVVGLGAGRRVDVTGPDEVVALLREVNDLLERLEVAWTSQTRFTADAAHELRTPVTVLRGQLEVARRRPRSPEELGPMIDTALDAARRLDDLVNGLLLLTRLDAGEAERGRETVRLGEVVDVALDQEAAALAAAGVEVAVEIEADDPVPVQRALAVASVGNLLRNVAVHAPGAPARVRVRRDGDRAEVVVEDGGPGIPEVEREHVFARLARGESADRAPGLGLGLALAREIARHHGGDCTVGHAPGGGAGAPGPGRAPPDGAQGILNRG